MERGIVVCLAMLVAGCSAPQSDPMLEETGSTGELESTGELSAGHPGQLLGPPRARRCVAPQGLGTPETIQDAVDLLNALPPPVDVACFLESLDRPLSIHASASTFSAQPSLGPEDPRVFVFSGDLVMSVVSGGDGVRLLEFGEFIDDTHTIKGEVELPHEGTVLPEDPYERVLFQEGTGCGLCHHEEQPVPGIEYAPAFSSLALRPTRDHDIEVQDVLASYGRCDWDDTPERCHILTALFGHGEVLHREFPEHLPTLGG